MPKIAGLDAGRVDIGFCNFLKNYKLFINFICFFLLFFPFFFSFLFLIYIKHVWLKLSNDCCNKTRVIMSYDFLPMDYRSSGDSNSNRRSGLNFFLSSSIMKSIRFVIFEWGQTLFGPITCKMARIRDSRGRRPMKTAKVSQDFKTRKRKW